ncbi:nucleoside triphosphate pyrophosphohydrolase [SAR92 clade bacterium H455]|uniref:Nucleoside triphosphate pyrophosphohydrolase n=1 Tax=SAR92 clade bacterium H455 TaxID=2974818 RepID=A0ABY5TQM6_9GAMM|nr:nucleoside triphosphate pyrophosphohydrolase [SAR92 clade bacterium H455]
MTRQYTVDDLRYLMQRLRNPESGCPWDLKQSFSTIAKHTLEEVYEVIDAIERNDLHHLGEELGDLLFQVIFYAELGAEQKIFDFDSVVQGLVEKLVRRHPHVFPLGTLESQIEPGSRVDNAEEQARIKKVWEEIKAEERAAKGEGKTLDDIPLAIPALSRAQKLQKRAASKGFDWQHLNQVVEVVRDELEELEAEIAINDTAAIEDELGDLLFSCVNLARHLDVDPERALCRANGKFQRRFQAMEELAQQAGSDFSQLSTDKMEELWVEVKLAE